MAEAAIANGITYQHISVDPMTPTIGAEISNVRLAEHSEAAFSEIQQAFLDHQVIVFRDQELSPGQQLAFARRFGDLHVHTGYSTDAWKFGVRTTPDDAYRYAFGGEILLASNNAQGTQGTRPTRIDRPLDFLGVTLGNNKLKTGINDHANSDVDGHSKE